MNAMEDPEISREAKKGFYAFLYSEQLRHQEDIGMIVDMMRKIEEEEKYTRREMSDLRKYALRYVKF